MYRNDSPRLKYKLYEITKEIMANRNLLEHFFTEFKENLFLDEENYVCAYLLKNFL